MAAAVAGAVLPEVVAALRAELNRLAETVRLKMGPVDVALEVDAQRDKLDQLERLVMQMAKDLGGVAAARSLNTVSPAPMRDLRTPDQVARDDVQRLEQRIAALEAAVFGPINGDC